MGNNLSDQHEGFKSYISTSEDAKKEDPNDVTLFDEVESELQNINTTMSNIRGKPPDEVEHQLHTLLINTEKKLSHVNHQKKHKWHVTNPFKRKDADVSDRDSHLKEEYERLKLDFEDLKKNRIVEVDKLRKELNDAIDKLENEEMKNVQLLTRLSKEAGEKLTKDNPAITNLSDTNRPTKLGEMYSELYDNEWTNAFDGLSNAGHGEREAIDTLYLTFLNVYDFCNSKADKMLTKTDDAVHFLFEEYKLFHKNNEQIVTRMSLKRISSTSKTQFEENSTEEFDLKQRWIYKTDQAPDKNKNRASSMVERSDKILDKLKDFQKEVAEIMIPVVQKAYLKASWVEEECVPELKPFLKKCIFICWMMVVRSPPMCIHILDLKEQNRFDKNLYREYTTIGPLVEYVVWPAILLHENGPVVGKGIVQCFKPVQNTKDNASVC